jgi:hypothetical protein
MARLLVLIFSVISVLTRVYAVSLDGVYYNFSSSPCGRVMPDAGRFHVDTYMADPRTTACIQNTGIHLHSKGAILYPAYTKSFDAVLEGIRQQQEFTAEVALVSDPARQGTSDSPARILAVSSDILCPDDMDLVIGQAQCDLVVRVRTDATTDCQMATTTAREVLCRRASPAEPVHVAVARNRTHTLVYVNGSTVATSMCTGSVTSWANYPLLFGNELTLGRQWTGMLVGASVIPVAMLNEKDVKEIAEQRLHDSEPASKYIADRIVAGLELSQQQKKPKPVLVNEEEKVKKDEDDAKEAGSIHRRAQHHAKQHQSARATTDNSDVRAPLVALFVVGILCTVVVIYIFIMCRRGVRRRSPAATTPPSQQPVNTKVAATESEEAVDVSAELLRRLRQGSKNADNR